MVQKHRCDCLTERMPSAINALLWSRLNAKLYCNRHSLRNANSLFRPTLPTLKQTVIASAVKKVKWLYCRIIWFNQQLIKSNTTIYSYISNDKLLPRVGRTYRHVHETWYCVRVCCWWVISNASTTSQYHGVCVCIYIYFSTIMLYIGLYSIVMLFILLQRCLLSSYVVMWCFVLQALLAICEESCASSWASDNESDCGDYFDGVFNAAMRCHTSYVSISVACPITVSA